jgi:hypothetical protein
MALRPFRFSKPVHSTSYATPPKKIFGGAEIRTLGGLTPTTVFKTAALDHSATPPKLKQEKLLKNSMKYIPGYIKSDVAEINK